MTKSRPPVVYGSLPPRQRSKVSNGKVLPGTDGRSSEARRLRDVYDAVILQYGIIDEVRMGLARRFANLTVFAEGEEAKMARGEPYDAERLIRACNGQRRIKAELEGRKRPKRRPKQ